MATRRARFKPVLNQPARRGRPGAPEGQSDAAKDSVATPDQPEKNAPTTPKQTSSAVKPAVLSPSPVKTSAPCEPEKPTSDSAAPKASQKDGTDVAAAEVPKGKRTVKAPTIPPKRIRPTASASKQDAAPAAPAAPAASEGPELLPPPPRPSTPVSGSVSGSVCGSPETIRSTSDLSSPPPKGETTARTSKDERKETAPIVKQRRAPSSTNQRALAARRNFMKLAKNGPPERKSLTMFDLIFYNPITNPMPNKSPPPATPAKKRDRLSSTCSVSTLQEERLDEEKVDDIDDTQMKESEDKENKDAKEDEEEEEPAVPVPRVKVGPDGRIVIDEQSLVIETTETKKNRAEMDKSEVVFDTGLSNGFYKRTKRSKDWSNRDTLKFYRALQVYGTDFSLMQVLFKDRSRKELKLKFKKEERMRGGLVDNALWSPLDFDTTELEREAQEEEEADEAARLAKEKEEQEEKLKPKPPKQKRKGNPLCVAQKEMVGPDHPEVPIKKKAPRKPKAANPAVKAKGKEKPAPKVGLDLFDDVMLPTDPVPGTSASANAPKKKAAAPKKQPAEPKKRKAPPRDPSQPPKKAKKRANVFMSPESDHSYAASPSRSPRTNGTPVTKSPHVRPSPKPSTSTNIEVQSPDYLTIDLSDHVVLSPPPVRTVVLPNEFCPQYTTLQTPRTPVTVNVTQSAGVPTEFRSPSGPAPNRAVPVITYPQTARTVEVHSPTVPAPSRAVPVIALPTLPTKTAGLPTEQRSPSGPPPVNRAVPVITLAHTAGLQSSPTGPSPSRAVPVITLATQSPGLKVDMSGPSPSRAVPVITMPSAHSPGIVPVQPRPPTVEPGSLYVLQTQDPNDPKRKVLGVYMVTNSQPKVGASPSHEPVPLVGDAAKTPPIPMSPAIIKDPVEGTVLTKL